MCECNYLHKVWTTGQGEVKPKGGTIGLRSGRVGGATTTRFLQWNNDCGPPARTGKQPAPNEREVRAKWNILPSM